MQLKSEPYDGFKHDRTLRAWWSHYGWGAMDVRILPRGTVIEDRDGMVAVGFVHCSKDAAMAVLAWPMLAPDCKNSAVLRYLVEDMVRLAREHTGPHGLILGFSKNRAVKHAYAAAGLGVAGETTSMALAVGNIDPTFMMEDDNAADATAARTSPRSAANGSVGEAAAAADAIVAGWSGATRRRGSRSR